MHSHNYSTSSLKINSVHFAGRPSSHNGEKNGAERGTKDSSMTWLNLPLTPHKGQMSFFYLFFIKTVFILALMFLHLEETCIQYLSHSVNKPTDYGKLLSRPHQCQSSRIKRKNSYTPMRPQSERGKLIHYLTRCQ